MKELNLLPRRMQVVTLRDILWWRSHFNLDTTLGMIGNVSTSAGILILQGENDTKAPVQQAFVLQQRLIDVNHPDHTLITYPNLGHLFPSNQWITAEGPDRTICFSRFVCMA